MSKRGDFSVAPQFYGIGSIWVAPFSGVNESTWEHMKLLFWPLFLFALVQRLFFRKQENYWCVKLAEILLDDQLAFS